MTQDTEPRNNVIVLYGILSALSVTILTVALILLFMHTAVKDLHSKVESAPTDQLDALHTRENALLLAPFYDGQEKIARIPITTAMELEAKAPWHPQATPLPALTAPAASDASTSDSAATSGTATSGTATTDQSTSQTQTPAAAVPAAPTEPANAASH